MKSSWHAAVRFRRDAFALDVAIEGGTDPVALVGPNGSGKSTFLLALLGGVPGATVELGIAGRVLESAARTTCVPIERRNIGYVPQHQGLFAHMTVEDNVAFGLRDTPRTEARRRARELLEEFGCGELARRRGDELSGGERQRVALARAFAPEPELLLLDEPLTSLDATVRRSTRALLAERLRARRCPSLVVTHDVRDVEALDARVFVLEEGRVVQFGSLDDLREGPGTDFVAEFLGL